EPDDRNGGAGGGQISNAGPAQRALQGSPVPSLDPAEDAVAEDAPRLAIRQISKARNQPQREQQRSELRKSDRIDHGIKQLCLDPLEGEQRQIGRDDDQGCEEDRPRDLVGGSAGVSFGERLVRLGFATPQDRFRHDNCCINNDPEIDCAERQQVCGNFEEIHQDEDRHHGKRNGDADNQGAAWTAEEKNEHNENEAYALKDGVRDLADRLADEVRAVVVGYDLHVVVRQTLVELGNFGMDAVQDPRGVVVFQQQDGAFDDVVLLVLADNAVPFQVG